VFSLFTRRHHCRLSGNCYTDACTRYMQPLPDSGYYHEQRVADSYIGLESTDLVEDVLLVCARRTELVSILNQRWQTLECGGSLPVKFSNTLKLTGGLTGDNGGGSHGFFSSAGALQQPSVLATEVVFSEGVFVSPPKQKRGARAAPVVVLTAGENLSQNFEVRVERDRQGKFLISSPAGLSHDVVIEKQKRAAKRQKAKLEKRKKLDAERQERAAVREAQRENDRLIRLGEKKAQKAAEKAARKESEQQAVEAESVRVLKQKPKAVPEAKPVSGGANNELAAALARRKANP
jgi:myosin-1